MKKSILLFILSVTGACTFAQSPFTIATPTLIPQNPTTADQVKIVIQTTTSSSSTKIDSSFTVNTAQKTIDLTNCFYIGMASVLIDYTDTFSVGQLPAGAYTLTYTAVSSSSLSSCIPQSSQTATMASSFTVTSVTSIAKNTHGLQLNVYPNPFKNKFVIESTPSAHLKGLKVINVLGETVYETLSVKSKTEIDLENLPSGIYWLRMENSTSVRSIKIVKE